MEELGMDPDEITDEDCSSLRYTSVTFLYSIKSTSSVNISRLVEQAGIFSHTLQPTSSVNISLLRYVCEAVSRRASMMASAGITALLKKMDYKDVVIAIDGSLFRYRHFTRRMMIL